MIEQREEVRVCAKERDDAREMMREREGGWWREREREGGREREKSLQHPRLNTQYTHASVSFKFPWVGPFELNFFCSNFK